MEQLERIAYMERILDAASAVKDDPTAFLSLGERIEELIHYYTGPLWMSDYEDDCADKLPVDLKRGVLSQDAVYDLLVLWEELHRDAP